MYLTRSVCPSRRRRRGVTAGALGGGRLPRRRGRAHHSLPCPKSQTAAPYAGPDGRAAPGNASLASVCFKPFGSACATQSVLQYWRMDRDFYEKEMVRVGAVRDVGPLTTA